MTMLLTECAAARAAGFDSSLHISEEAENARVAVPRGLVGATLVAGIMGWGEPFISGSMHS